MPRIEQMRPSLDSSEHEPVEGFEIDQKELDKKLGDAVIGKKKWIDERDYWDDVLKLAEDGNLEGVEALLEQRSAEYQKGKMPGEDEVWGELQKLDKKQIHVKLNEKGIIVPDLEEK
jgi:hypothetical protein